LWLTNGFLPTGVSRHSTGRWGKVENPKQTDTVNDDPNESGLFASKDSFVKKIFLAHLTPWLGSSDFQASQ
jgi:hypothetical protein